MSATVFHLRGEPDQRLDLSVMTPSGLRDRSEAEIAGLPIGTTRVPVSIGDVFTIALGDRDRIQIRGGSDRLDGVGTGLASGEIRVEGQVGLRAGKSMSGGRLVIEGSAGPLAGARMTGGMLQIYGDAGEFAGGTVPGAMSGMRGGMLMIGGSAGDRLGDRMRGGLIVVHREAGRFAGSRMLGGTILARCVGSLPGYLMRRGSMIVWQHGEVAPTFLSSGIQELQFLNLVRTWLARQDQDSASLVPHRAERLQGDMATLGRGEILIACP